MRRRVIPHAVFYRSYIDRELPLCPYRFAVCEATAGSLRGGVVV
jgi:hypothetical protein